MADHTRHSIIAGQWYPGTARELRRTVERFLVDAKFLTLDGPVIGLISPHAGYTYSGQTAAHAYRQVQGNRFDVVVVISPLHRLPLGRFAVSSADAYETPLGLVELDVERISALEREIQVKRVAFDGEHSLEIQLPFLQVALGEFTLLPVMVGDSSFEAGVELGAALARVLSGSNALLIASSDMHHIDDYAQVVQRDQVVIDAIATFDMRRIREALSPWDCSVCGRIPIFAMLTAAQAMGADRIEVLHQTNSGDVTGIRTRGQYTVGYMAAAVYKSSR